MDNFLNVYTVRLRPTESFSLSMCFHLVQVTRLVETEQAKQACKSSEDAQAAGYAQFEKVWAGSPLGRKSLDPKYLHTCNTLSENTLSENTLLENTLPENTLSENTFSENMLIMVIIMIVMVTMVIMVIKVVRVASVKSSIGIFTHQGHISKVNANA